jgi:ketosteroid isomerase-like protein
MAPSVPADAAARAWVAAWSDGWANHDPDVIADRYATSCVFLSHPFRVRARGRGGAATWIREAFAEERAARFVFAEPIVSADARAAVEYRAVITAKDGAEQTLAGTTILRFDVAGLVVEHRDYWLMADGDLGLDWPSDLPEEASK